MRNLPATVQKKIASRIQTGDNAWSSSLWVGRPTTPLTENRYLEKQVALSTTGVTKTSIAVCHPRLLRGATEVYIGYLKSGTIKIAKTNYVEEMSRHEWQSDIGYAQEADDFCLCYDGTMPKAPSGWVEFKTEQFPWVFWVLDGILYGRRLWDETEPVILVEANCSTVSAIRAMWSTTGGFDFGLVVFFLLNGQLYYRQLINGTWYDAEIVTFGPAGVSWKEIAAFRTWDYRIGVQGKTTTGEVYELITQFMGIGKQNAEHIEVQNVIAKSNLIGITQHDTKEQEHVEVANVTAGAPYGGLYSTDVPLLTSAYNVADEYGDWGKIVIVTFDNYLVAAEVATNYTSFSLIDSWGAAYYPGSATLGEDGMTVTLVFQDFNPAYDVCELRYTPGTVHSMAAILVQATSVQFTPQNLNPPDIPQPEVESIWNE